MLPKPIKDEYKRSTTMTVETNLRVPMRDGTVLAADLYRPAGGGRYPVLLKRTPYGKQKPRYHSLYMDPVRAASRGYAVVFQDTRGRHASEGEFYPFRHFSVQVRLFSSATLALTEPPATPQRWFCLPSK